MKVMRVVLTADEIKALEVEHRTERDRRIADRIKAVILHARGWTQILIAQALLISPETVHDHLQEYIKSNKLKPENGGSDSKLNSTQTSALITHLENTTYMKANSICAYVHQKYNIQYTVSGMTKWLKLHGFSYKKPKGTPAKADLIKQEDFLMTYNTLLETTHKDEPILFGDAVHPTMATKITYGWIKKGTDKPIATVASRTRMNLMGAINLQTMGMVYESYETINSDTMNEYFTALRTTYATATKIHLILDRGPYNTSLQTQNSAKEHGIVLHYLPAYSPNLNPIERVWKLMNEYVRNNRVFTSAKEFRQDILAFFNTTWPKISNTMRDRINDNFQTLKPVSSG
jgi:transposase